MVLDAYEPPVDFVISESCPRLSHVSLACSNEQLPWVAAVAPLLEGFAADRACLPAAACAAGADPRCQRASSCCRPGALPRSAAAQAAPHLCRNLALPSRRQAEL